MHLNRLCRSMHPVNSLGLHACVQVIVAVGLLPMPRTQKAALTNDKTGRFRVHF